MAQVQSKMGLGDVFCSEKVISLGTYKNQWNLMIFDLEIGTKTVQNRSQDGLKGVLFSSSIFVPIWARAWLHFGSFWEPFGPPKVTENRL